MFIMSIKKPATPVTMHQQLPTPLHTSPSFPYHCSLHMYQSDSFELHLGLRHSGKIQQYTYSFHGCYYLCS